MKINLEKFIKPKTIILSGRPQGEKVREDLFVDTLDNDKETHTIIIPNRIRTFATSYFLGLFSKSVITLGKEKFLKKYIFKNENEPLKQAIKKDIDEGIEWAINENKILE